MPPSVTLARIGRKSPRVTPGQPYNPQRVCGGTATRLSPTVAGTTQTRLACRGILLHAESDRHDARADIGGFSDGAYWDVLVTAIQGGNQFILFLRNFDSEHPTIDRTPDGVNPSLIPSGAWLAPLLDPLRAATPIISLLNMHDNYPWPCRSAPSP